MPRLGGCISASGVSVCAFSQAQQSTALPTFESEPTALVLLFKNLLRNPLRQHERHYATAQTRSVGAHTPRSDQHGLRLRRDRRWRHPSCNMPARCRTRPSLPRRPRTATDSATRPVSSRARPSRPTSTNKILTSINKLAPRPTSHRTRPPTKMRLASINKLAPGRHPLEC